ncbi:hypothetical protein BGZ60DRAFT_512219 [Tricladium varicosporioides]|nr:hypothetical protein BGZ60DRAFT_512219 [Hymenoscyphus varicosporioides]
MAGRRPSFSVSPPASLALSCLAMPPFLALLPFPAFLPLPLSISLPLPLYLPLSASASLPTSLCLSASLAQATTKPHAATSNRLSSTVEFAFLRVSQGTKAPTGGANHFLLPPTAPPIVGGGPCSS